LHKQNRLVEAYSCTPTFYNYEKEDHEHDCADSNVYCAFYWLCSEARGTTTTATRSSGATTTASTI
jgi:hypothetical protein